MNEEGIKVSARPILVLTCLNLINYERFFSIIFLTFRVSEGALSISILVSIIRTLFAFVEFVTVVVVIAAIGSTRMIVV